MSVSRTIRLRRESWGFAVGSLLFAVGAVLSASVLIDVVVTNLIFFTGALFFTAAAFIQLAMTTRPRRDVTRADALDWWAAVVQFGGTLFFNLSTTEALLNALDPTSHLRTGWRPDVFGSACFLVAGVLAILATTMRDRLWDPNARIWRCTWLNMAGSIFFAISAVGAYVAPPTGEVLSELWANLGTILGAACFLAAALLSRDAAVRPPSAPRHR
jgi:drug/metabolite transporter (DMT)-like permease